MLPTVPRPHPSPEDAPDPRRNRRHVRGGNRRLVTVLVVLALVLVPVEVSYGRALVAPGQATVSVRTVEWLRDHGAGPLVNVVENYWYARNRPTGAAPDPASLPSAASSGMGAVAGARPAALPLGGGARLPGEAMWLPSDQRVGGSPPLYTAYFRPLPRSPSVVVGVAWINQSLVRTRLIAGTADPAPAGSAPSVDNAGAQVPPALRSALLATFNSGFKLKDARGGYYTNGRELQPLRPGAASLAIDTSGRIDIGQWGRDLSLTAGTAAVRQNLALVVDGGAVVPGLDENATGAWGSARNQLQYTWRSGLGVDAAGNLVYVAADQLSLADLARAMTAAGVVRGMQLDIHPQMVAFLSYGPGQAATARAGTKLLPAMRAAPDRYLRPDQRDFLTVTARPAPVGP